MQDGCKGRHEFLRDIEWIMFRGHLDCFQKSSLGGRPSTKRPGYHGTPNPSVEKAESQTLTRSLILSSNAHNESSYLSLHHGRIQECN